MAQEKEDGVVAWRSYRKPLRVFRNLEDPLPQRHADDREAAALRQSVNHLLIREDGAELRAPVDSYLRLEGQTLAEELQEDPVRPLDVIDVGRRELARPVVREA